MLQLTAQASVEALGEAAAQSRTALITALIMSAALIGLASYIGVVALRFKTFARLAVLFFWLCGLGSVYLLLGRQFSEPEVGPILAGDVRWISVNGYTLPDPGALFSALKSLQREPPATPPRPVSRDFKVRFETSTGNLELTLARDAADPQNYWVSYQRQHGKIEPIGHMSTGVLDGF